MSLPLSSNRRRAAALLATLLLATSAPAQDSGPITLLVGFPAGGGADFAARVLAEKLSLELGRRVLVDNRPGAGGQLAARALKAAPADGSVLFLSNSHTLATVPHTFRKPGYDADTDFRAVANFANFETVVACSGQIGVTSFADLHKWVGTKSAGLNVGVPAPGSVPDFIASAIGRLWNVKIQPVAYRGAAPLAQDLVGGQVEAGIVTSVEALTFGAKGGHKLRALAVSHRTPLLPDVPSFDEVGLKGLDATDLLGVYAPAGLSDAAASHYAAAIKKVAEMPEVIERLRQAGQEGAYSTGAELRERVRRLHRQNGELMRAAGYTPE